MVGKIDRKALLAQARAYRERAENLEAENADLKAALAKFGVTEQEDTENE